MNAAARGRRRRPGAAWYRSARRRRRCSGASGPSRCRCSTTPRPDQNRPARRGVLAGRARGVRDRPLRCVYRAWRRTSAPRRPGQWRVLRHWVPGVCTRRPTSCETAQPASARPGPRSATRGVRAFPDSTTRRRASPGRPPDAAWRRWCTTLRLRRGSCRLSGHGDRCGCAIST